MDSFQYSEPKQDIRGFQIQNKPVSFFPYPICGTVNLNSNHNGFSSQESPLYATTEGTGNYVEMSSPTVATTPTATGERHNVLEQYISPTSNCSDRPYFSEEEQNPIHTQQEMNQIEAELGKALHCLQSERDKQYSEIENLKNEIFSLKAEKSSRSPQTLSQLQMSQQSSKLAGAVNLSRVTHFREDVQTPTNFPRQVEHSPRRPTLLTSLSTPGFESCASGQTYQPSQHSHIRVMGERQEIDERILQPRDQNRPHNVLNESQTPAFGENAAPLLSSAKKYTETNESISHQSPIPFKAAERFMLESTEGRQLFEKIDFLEKENRQLHSRICAIEVQHARKLDEKEAELRRNYKNMKKFETQQAQALELLHQTFIQLFIGIEKVATQAKKDGKEFFTKKPVKAGSENQIDLTLQKKQYFLTLLQQLDRYLRVRIDERKGLLRKYQDLSSVHASFVRVHSQKQSFDINNEIDRLRMENRRLKSDLQARQNTVSDNLSEGRSIYCATNSSTSNTPRCEKSCRSTSQRGIKRSTGVEAHATVKKSARASQSPLPVKKKKVTTVEMLAQKLERMEERMNEFTTVKKTKEIRQPNKPKKPTKITKSVQRRTAEDNRVSRCSSNSTLVPPVSSIYPQKSTNSLSQDSEDGGILATPLTSSIWSPETPVLIQQHKSGAKTARKRSGSKSGTRYIQYVDDVSDNTTLMTNISISHVKGKKRKHTPVREKSREHSGSCQRPACPGYREL